ncbi:hypothetical protein BT93_L2774 [Corymbia citriodora subsp. variegata]|uniref:Uncharacterized protein n=1 Tax=Corymbia citriodora subsp. variegata TaxID=360336 RepID=A0A8T0CIV5_CORYI|nr:hypothetical protein BT93_L2774 [Corymbia citriodora subsp. variegata]
MEDASIKALAGAPPCSYRRSRLDPDLDDLDLDLYLCPIARPASSSTVGFPRISRVFLNHVKVDAQASK